MTKTLKKIIISAVVTGLVVLANGCINGPRPRMGCLPTSTPGSRFLDPNNLGLHSYGYGKILFEKNGIVYTCKAGHIDITHSRWSADYTKYLIQKINKTLMKKRKGFSFTLTFERSKHKVKFTYPENWDSLSKKDRQKIANDIAFKVGPYLAFNATLWHEILTWFGVHFIGFEPEFNSAFSWEDSFSNLLGTRLAVEALQDGCDDGGGGC